MENRKFGIFSAGKRGKTLVLILLTGSAIILFPNVLKDTVTLFLGGTVIAFLLRPLAAFYEKRLKPAKAAALALISAAAGLIAVLFLFFPFIIKQLGLFAHKLPAVLEQLRNWAGAFQTKLGLDITAHIPDFSLLTDFPGDFSSIAHTAMNFAVLIADKIYRLVLMAVLACFLLTDRHRILLRAELLLPCMHRKKLIRHAGMLVSELKMYLRGQATIALCVGSIASLALILIGVPGGIILGVVVGVFNIIPYFGPILGGIPAVLMALGESWQKATASLAALVIIQQIDGMVISPRVMGSATGFSPGTVLIALYAFSRLFGIAGLLFAMPLLMAIRTLYRVFVQRYEKN